MGPLRVGDTVVLRYFKRGSPSGVMPTRVVAVEGGPVLWLPPGTIVGWPAVEGRPIGDIEPAERYAHDWGVHERPWAGDPFGAKGVGELPMDGGAPAVAQAIENATGLRVTEIPATPEKLLAAERAGSSVEPPPETSPGTGQAAAADPARSEASAAAGGTA